MNVNLLALETSGTRCGVALLRHVDGVSQMLVREHDGVQEHAERLLPMVDELLAEAGLAACGLGVVAFGQGPGGFTGLRVACGVAQGLGMALDVPVVPVPSHAAVASGTGAGPGDAVAVALDARMDESYMAAYRCVAERWQVLQDPVLVPAAAAERWLQGGLPSWSAAAGTALVPLLAGDGWGAVAGDRQWRCSPVQRPDAGSVARLGLQAWQAGLALPPDAAAPLYVRDKVAYTTAERQAGLGGNPRAAEPAAEPTAAQALRIEPMSEGDLDAVVAIEQAVQSYPWTRRNFADALAAGYPAWVVREGGRTTGFYVMMQAPDVAHLLVIAVARDRQGRGTGRALLAHCERQALQAGAPGLLLEVRPSNLQALGFYRHSGFVQIGVRRGYYPNGRDRREDALVMQKPLAAPAA